jgi:hypothetical protein
MVAVVGGWNGGLMSKDCRFTNHVSNMGEKSELTINPKVKGCDLKNKNEALLLEKNRCSPALRAIQGGCTMRRDDSEEHRRCVLLDLDGHQDRHRRNLREDCHLCASVPI